MAAERTKSYKVVSHGAGFQRSISPLVDDITVLDTEYADDMAVLDNSKEGLQLQETTDLLCMNAAQGGLRINGKKTEAMVIGKATSRRPYTKAATVKITVEDTPMQQVGDFTYLGTIISSDGTIDRELSARIHGILLDRFGTQPKSSYIASRCSSSVI